MSHNQCYNLDLRQHSNNDEVRELELHDKEETSIIYIGDV